MKYLFQSYMAKQTVPYHTGRAHSRADDLPLTRGRLNSKM